MSENIDKWPKRLSEKETGFDSALRKTELFANKPGIFCNPCTIGSGKFRFFGDCSIFASMLQLMRRVHWWQKRNAISFSWLWVCMIPIVDRLNLHYPCPCRYCKHEQHVFWCIPHSATRQAHRCENYPLTRQKSICIISVSRRKCRAFFLRLCTCCSRNFDQTFKLLQFWDRPTQQENAQLLEKLRNRDLKHQINKIVDETSH